MNDSKKAAKTRRDLIRAEQQRLKTADARIEALKKEHAKVAEPVLAFKEAEQKMRALGREIEGALRLNAHEKAEFKRALAANADPRLTRLVAEARQELNRRTGAGSAAEISRTLHVREWLDEVEPALGNPDIDDDAVDALIQRGERMLSPATEAVHAD